MSKRKAFPQFILYCWLENQITIRRINAILQSIDWTLFSNTLKMPTTFLSPSQACGAITHQISHAAQISIPICATPNHASAHYWTPACSNARKEMRLALTRYNNQRGNIEKWQEYKRLRAHFRRQVLLAKKASWHQFTSTLTTTTPSAVVYNKVRRLCNTATSKTIVLLENGEHVSSPEKVCNILAQQFSRISNGTPTDEIFKAHQQSCEKNPIQFPPNSNSPYNKPLTMTELKHALATSRSRSPGPDNISYEIINHMEGRHLEKLLSFYNYLYNTGYPHQWREGNIVPICKPHKNPADKLSYRPITLLNCLGKTDGQNDHPETATIFRIK